MTIGKIGVVGAGTMGNGIAQAFAVAGQDVVMMDVGEAQVQRGLATIGASLDRLIKRDRMTAAQKDAAMARISTATDTSALSDSDLVIEALERVLVPLFHGIHDSAVRHAQTALGLRLEGFSDVGSHVGPSVKWLNSIRTGCYRLVFTLSLL